jgi:hypothetical protein
MKALYAKLHQKFWHGLELRLDAVMDRTRPRHAHWHMLNDLDWLLNELAYWTSPNRKELTPARTTTTR